MSGGKFKRIILGGVVVLFSTAALALSFYLYPSGKALKRQRLCRLNFVDELRKQLPQNDRHRWHVYADGEADSSLVFICPNCGSGESADYANTNRQWEDKARELDFTYAEFGNGKSDKTTINLRLEFLKRILKNL